MLAASARCCAACACCADAAAASTSALQHDIRLHRPVDLTPDSTCRSAHKLIPDMGAVHTESKALHQGCHYAACHAPVLHESVGTRLDMSPGC